MNRRISYRALAAIAFLGGVLALILLAQSLVTGVSQEAFEMVIPVDRYADRLVSQAGGLRFAFTIDFLFIGCFTSFFVLFGAALRDEADRWVVAVAVGAMVLTGLLDAIEDTHILSMLASASMGRAPAAGEIQWQSWASATKFFASYSGLFLFSFALTRTTRWESWLRLSLRYLQFPIGALALTAAGGLVRPVLLIRALFYVAGFLLAALTCLDRARRPAG